VAHAPACAGVVVLTGRHQPDPIVVGARLESGDGTVLAEEIGPRPATASIPMAISTGQPLSARPAESLAGISVRTPPTQATLESIERGNGRLLPLCRRLTHASPPYPPEARPTGAADAVGVGRTTKRGRLIIKRLVVTAPATLAVPREPLQKGY
jgi:hypothetical protein